MKPWALTEEFSEGKYLVVRRDGTVPHWPHFVLAASDPATPEALRAYAAISQRMGMEADYVHGVLDLADQFAIYYEGLAQKGDPEAGPHRKDDPNVIHAMRGGSCEIYVTVDTEPKRKVVNDD